MELCENHFTTIEEDFFWTSLSTSAIELSMVTPLMLDLHSKWCGELTLHYHGGLLVICQGNFCSPSIGTYKLIWDNTYSNFYRKVPDNNIVSSNLKFEVFIVLSMLLTCSKQIVALVFPFMCGLEVSQNPIKPRFLQFFLLLSEASKWLRSFYKAILWLVGC